MRLYDTAKQQVTSFEPAAGAGGTVTMYTCGITPYDAAHLGHAATYLTYDVIQRRLRDLGYLTRLVRNVTDVDDDMLRKARELGVYYLDLAAEEMATFSADMDALGLLAAASEPRATSAIPDILGFIGMVLANRHAYQAGGAVYFNVSSWAKFGSVSHYSREKMLALARERGGNPDDPAKRDPLDFVLWQPSAPDEPAWKSMWGPGRPGWHIECSALALRELGTTIDLHGGGSDLVFPHHECESAQSEAATGEPFVRHWVHAGMVCYEGAKMSKSLGNLVFVRDLLKTWDPAAIRLAVLAHHYRSDWEWNDQLLPEATARLARWRAAVGDDGHEGTGHQGTGHEGTGHQGTGHQGTGHQGTGHQGTGHQGTGPGVLDQVREALDDDLDTARALAAIDAAVIEKGPGTASARMSSAPDTAAAMKDAASLLGVQL
jgi:L-cysteine:1D-myo-inositol 2-amino-2-deoxy-alpha-D-glucopyranoside ligase